MESQSMRKIPPKDLKEGMRFSAPVFFDDGENMFLSERRPLKKYQILILSKWSIPYVVTYGRAFTSEECNFFEKREKELAEKAAKSSKTIAQLSKDNNIDDVDELQEVEELEEVSELEEI